MSDKMQNLLIDLSREFLMRLNVAPVCMLEFLAECHANDASPEIIAFVEAYNAIWNAADELNREDPRFCMTEKGLLIFQERALGSGGIKAKYDSRSEHPLFTRSQWVQEVADSSTDLGYWDWVCDMVMIVDIDREDGR